MTNKSRNKKAFDLSAYLMMVGGTITTRDAVQHTHALVHHLFGEGMGILQLAEYRKRIADIIVEQIPAMDGIREDVCKSIFNNRAREVGNEAAGPYLYDFAADLLGATEFSIAPTTQSLEVDSEADIFRKWKAETGDDDYIIIELEHSDDN
jgi:hypothetical protein